MNQQENFILNPKILGQLLLMQSILPTLPDEKSIFHFVCRGLLNIPGVETASHSDVIQESLDPSIIHFPLTVSNSEYGEFSIRISDPLAFEPYADYLKNFSFMVAVILEERNQRSLNELHQIELEQRIQERTLQLHEEIAEHQRTEDALRKSERKFRETVVNLDEGFYSVTLGGILLEHNQALNHILGFDQTLDLKGTRLADFWQNPNERQEYLNALEVTGAISNYQINAKTQKGKRITVLASAHMVNDENNRPLRIEGIFLDITERKRAEEELRKLSRKDEEALRIARMGHWEFDPATALFTFNDQYYSLHGTTAEEAGGYLMSAEKFASRYVHPDDAHLVGADIQQAIETNDPSFQIQQEVRVLRADGEPRHFAVWFRVEKDSQGRTTKLLGVNQDITERKRAEDALRESEARYRTLFEYAPDGILIADPESYYIDANASMCWMLGYTRDELIGLHTSDIVTQAEIQHIGPALSVIKAKSDYHREWQFRRKNGSVIAADVIATMMPDGNLLVMIRDITERKQAEQALWNAEARYRVLFEQSPNGILLIDSETSKVIEANDMVSEQLGYTREEFATLKISDWEAFEKSEEKAKHIQKVLIEGRDEFETLHRTKSGETRNVHVRVKTLEVGDRILLYSIFQDITERKQGEQALRQSEEEYRQLFQNNPNPMWAYDSETLAFLAVNDAAVRHYGYSREEFLAMTIKDIRPPEDISALIGEIAHLPAGLNESKVWRHIKKDGAIIYVEVRSHGSVFAGRHARIVLANDVTERKRAEEANRSYIHFLESLELIDKALRQETDIEQMLKNVMQRVLIIFNCDRTWLFYPCDPDAPTFRVPIEISRPEYPGASILNLDVPMDPSVAKDLRDALASEEPLSYTLGTETPVNTLSSQQFAVQAQMFMAIYPKIGKPWVFGMHQCSYPRIWTNDEKVLFKEIGRRVADGLSNTLFFRNLIESEERFRTLVNQAADAIFLHDLEGHLLDVNQRACDSLGYTREELLGMNIADMDVEFIRQNDVSAFWSQLGHDHPVTLESTHKRKDGTTFSVEIRLGLLQIEGKQSILALARDITARKQADERIQRQLEHLTALGTIDRAIVSNFDLELSLSEILTHVTMELGIDAADILILNSNSQMLEFSAGCGFRTKAIEDTRLRLGESHAGRAALERHLVHISNLKDTPDLLLTKNLSEEGFESYYAVPLIAKGQVRGVLEVFHRTALESDAEWLDFLNTLAGQTVIAIENAMLFENLERSNSELILAYDATIEGWSRALDLRDKETEGHTQRVTQMAVTLARAFGLSDDELVQVRWGALLHDIGKMGVPDEILHKPGPLTNDEWVLMRKHPTYAYEMLAPIRYLRLALDIPYCHHEKWDGSGYPQGLIGDQIPLIARIFAVVDVWDALSSDRPYRAAWVEEKVREYIQTSLGTHFDPQVVDVFMHIPN